MVETATHVEYPDLAQRKERGRLARDLAPPSAHLGWKAAEGRADPVRLLTEQDKSREPDLVPVRHGRMMVSPFTFYRGAAKIMAHDLATTPTAGLEVQLCGDAHLSNFGLFASPERNLLFDLNDFDETLPGPFEWDVKRMVASFVVAGRNNGFSEADSRQAAREAAQAYREAMVSFAGMGTLEIWYAHLDEDQLLRSIKAATKAEHKAVTAKAKSKKGKDSKKTKAELKNLARARKRAVKIGAKARTRDSLSALSKLGELVDGRYRIVSQPPIVVPARDLSSVYGISPDLVDEAVRKQFDRYRASLGDDRRALLERFEIVDVARKVVGVGSVGTRAFIALLQGRDADDPLFLQMKEATASVLEDHLPKSRYTQHGARVVEGQRMLQAASDIFLGWTKGIEADRHFYWRQLRDMKGSIDVEAMSPAGLMLYARTCGWTLARGHARSGDPVSINACLGTDAGFETAMTDFAARYADQNERDFAQFVERVRAGSVAAVTGM